MAAPARPKARLTAPRARRYEGGDHYHYHLDNGGAPNIAGRALTALAYLADDFEGGETNWPMAGLPDDAGVNIRHTYRVREHFDRCQTERGLTVRPRLGSVALFYSLLPNSEDKDWMAWHGSCDVTSGVKWAANFWWHLGLMRRHSRRGRPPPRPAAAAACADEEGTSACGPWVAAGECSKNPDFMHLRCRRSCGLCVRK